MSFGCRRREGKMSFIDMYDELKYILPQNQIKLNEPMKNHTSFRIGGPVDIMPCQKQ